MWMNVTQEGKSAVDDLREMGLVNGLKLTSEDFQPITAFQVSLKGLDVTRSIPRYFHDGVRALACGPKPFHKELLQCVFDGEKFKLVTESGFERVSCITDIEQVSYVGSPYLPRCIRTQWGKEMTSNKHRSSESAKGENTIKDDLSEAITLSHVQIYVGEWIPFGANQIVSLNERLGSLDRCQGGLFTSMVDKNPTDTQFQVAAGLTQVRIIDFDPVRFINFEAEINYPVEEGIIQVENFGMHLNVDGTVLYGMKIEAILDRPADNICLDHLARVLVDVHQDSSQIINDVLSGYQRSLLDMIFMKDADNRSKFNVITSDSITPKLPHDKCATPTPTPGISLSVLNNSAPADTSIAQTTRTSSSRYRPAHQPLTTKHQPLPPSPPGTRRAHLRPRHRGRRRAHPRPRRHAAGWT